MESKPRQFNLGTGSALEDMWDWYGNRGHEPRTGILAAWRCFTTLTFEQRAEFFDELPAWLQEQHKSRQDKPPGDPSAGLPAAKELSG